MSKELVKILAATDAIFQPARRVSSLVSAGITSARLSFDCEGVEYAGGGGAAERKRHERTLDGFVNSGWLLRVGKSRVKLTTIGADVARAMCFMPVEWQAIEVVKTLEDLAEKLGGAYDDMRAPSAEKWLPETVLIGHEWHEDGAADALWEYELRLLPALANGWVKSRCDCMGRAYYARVPNVPLPEIEWGRVADIEGDKRLMNMYFSARKAARAALGEYKGREIGEWGLHAFGWRDEFVTKYQAFMAGGKAA
jgi:hypothetical protein